MESNGLARNGSVANGFEIRPISGSIGAELLRVDLAAEPGHNVIAAIRQAWLEHGVIFFRDQDLPPAKFLAFARSFGEVVEYPFVKGIEGFPEIIPVVKLEHEKHNFGGLWHSDTTYLETPPMGTMLIAREVPPRGGDTLFANQYLAYETLSDGMKRMLSTLRAVHSDRKVAGPRSGANVGRTTKARDDADWRETVTVHPVVRTHPETGRQLLFVNAAYTVGFEGMTEAESKPLLDYLLEHGHRPEFTCRFRWTTGAVAFWDNRCVKHLAVNDSGPFRRLMRRIQICGDRVS